MIKRSIRRLLNHFGIVAFRRSSRVYIPEDESCRIVAGLVRRSNPVIIDGGAHLGDMVDRLGALLPTATFHCFEPDPELAGSMGSRYAGHENIHVNEAALGAVAGTARLSINASRATNSLLTFSDALGPELEQVGKLVKTAKVDVITIDEYCRRHAIAALDVLKLDLQGYDYMALKGAENILANTAVVLVEVLFREIYEKCHQFKDIFALLTAGGFDLYTLCGFHYGAKDELLWADAIFIKRPGFGQEREERQ